MGANRPGVAEQVRATRVLVVDNEVDAANTLSLLAKVWGHEVRTAYDAETALKVAEEFEPDVILLDLGMPKIDGFQAARRIRQQEGHERAILIAVSGYVGESFRALAREAGFNHFLAKPADPEEIRELLSKLSSVVTAVPPGLASSTDTASGEATIWAKGQ